jgi:hypothetical protein
MQRCKMQRCKDAKMQDAKMQKKRHALNRIRRAVYFWG